VPDLARSSGRRLAPVLVWAAVLFAASSVPGDQVPAVGFDGADKVAHVVLYAVLGVLLVRAFRSTSGGSRAKLVGVVTLATALYGASDELHQSFVPGRSPDVFDVLADTIGGVLGALAATWRRPAEPRP